MKVKPEAEQMRHLHACWLLLISALSTMAMLAMVLSSILIGLGIFWWFSNMPIGLALCPLELLVVLLLITVWLIYGGYMSLRAKYVQALREVDEHRLVWAVGYIRLLCRL